jgi:dolichyl-phosphate beta-glucosyltransferase
METSETGIATLADAEINTRIPEVSIVVPAFNEAGRIGTSLEKISLYLTRRHPSAEIIVVDDGSSDETAGIVGACDFQRLRMVRNEENQGKGYSIRRGFFEARGRWVLFTDADLSAPIQEMDRLMDEARTGADVVIGSRAVDRSKILVHQSRARELGGIIFNRIVRLILRLPIADTQCGFKLFERTKLESVFRRQRISGFGFDPEILFLARKAGLVIREIPVVWRHDKATKVRFLEDAPRMFFDLIRIRWNWIRGRYADTDDALGYSRAS